MKGGRTSKKWTKGEEKTLKKLYPLRIKKEISKKELMEQIPNRTWYGIQAHAIRRLGLAKRLKEGVLRECTHCGKEAKNSEDLEQFAKDLRYKYNRKNLCNVCSNNITISLRGKKPFHYLYMTKKSECKRRKIPFDLDELYLKSLWKKQGGKCAISNIKMGLPYQKGDWDLVGSLDRINYEGGYTNENIRWVLNCINTFKGQKDDGFVYSVAKAIVEARIRRENKND